MGQVSESVSEKEANKQAVGGDNRLIVYPQLSCFCHKIKGSQQTNHTFEVHLIIGSKSGSVINNIFF